MGMDNNQSERISLLKALTEQWKQIFNYKGTATKREYWCVLIFDLVIGVLAALAIWKGTYLKVVGIVILVYLTVALVPLVSLTVRRLHDTGKSGWWMILSFILVIGLIILAVMCIKPAAKEEPEEFYPEINIPMAVYGPPEIFEEDIPEAEDSEEYEEPEESDEQEGSEESDEQEERLIISPGFSPDLNVPEEVYGPPEMFE